MAAAEGSLALRIFGTGRYTDGSFAYFELQSVASAACSCWSSQLAAVYHDGRHRCACASTETRIGLSNLLQFGSSRTAVGRYTSAATATSDSSAGVRHLRAQWRPAKERRGVGPTRERNRLNCLPNFGAERTFCAKSCCDGWRSAVARNQTPRRRSLTCRWVRMFSFTTYRESGHEDHEPSG